MVIAKKYMEIPRATSSGMMYINAKVKAPAWPNNQPTNTTNPKQINIWRAKQTIKGTKRHLLFLTAPTMLKISDIIQKTYIRAWIP